ncbi:elongator complex protein 3 [Anaerosalibacter massiliensis]|uniref:Radical SAM protein n=1 Tax=Anaerosalibacter massiliensis TaxID=1347392 RepID=A0A9X2MG42_9FIRM|nr:radical SAM protein [Anaerosalibacter massiliensis]MCR2042597.1 radical SAM protein [Anaerosalibacter massiliensis]
MNKKYFIIPIFVPHLGCPHDCVFCNQRRITGLSTDMTSEKADNIIKDHLKTIPSLNRGLEIAFYGGSFTAISPDMQRELLNIASYYKKEGIVDRIRLSTRPDYINERELLLLKEYGVDIIELGVQSLDEEVLFLSGRGHKSEDVYKASSLIKSYGFQLGLQMMIGLLGDTEEKSLYTAKEIVKLNPICTRIYPTLVVKDTFLEKMYLDGRYKPLSLEMAVDISTKLLMIFQYNKINVIRIGLQPTDNITLGKDVIAGPFHPAFRQLVESNIYKKILDEYFSEKDFKDIKEFVININPKEISNLVGQGSINTKFIRNKFNISKIKIHGENIPKEIFYIKNHDFYDKINKDEIIEKYLLKEDLINN